MEETEQPKAAIYARSACGGDGRSLQDQIQACKAYADRMGWRIDDTLVFTDAGASGVTSTTERPGLTGLLDAAHHAQRHFAIVLVTEPSRIGRDTSVVREVLYQLEVQGVSIAFAEQELDSSTNPEYLRELLRCEYATSDAAILETLAQAVRRGHEACVAKGFIRGGHRRLGYNHVSVVDPTRKVGGRPMVTGFKATINPVEAAVVRRIFDLRASGLSYRHVADLLNAENSSAGSNLRKWLASAVRAIVSNPVYMGCVLYGRTRSFRDPKTGKTVVKHVPQAEWQHFEASDLRIVSDELWRKAQCGDEDRLAR